MRVVRIDGAEFRGPAAPPRSRLDARAGPGLLETMRARRGCIAHRTAHLARLAASRTALGLPAAPPASRIASELDALLEACPGDDLLVRLVVGPGALVVEAAPLMALPLAPGVQTAVTRAGAWCPAHAAAEHKHTERRHWRDAEAAATAAGADIVIATDAAGCLGEASRASVFVVDGGVLQTAPVEGLLPGIGRAAVIELAGAVVEESLPAERWRAADEIFTVSALRGVIAVTAIDGAPVGHGTPGPTTRHLAMAFRQRVIDATAAGRRP